MGGPHGITWIAWLVLAPISILFTIEVVPEGYSPGYSQTVGYLIGFLGHLITGLVLLLGKLTIFRNVANKPQPVLMLGWFAVAGLVRGASVAWMFENFGITQSADYFERMRSGAVLVLVWFAVSAVMVDGFETYSKSFRELSTQLSARKELRDAGQAKLQQRISDLVSQVRLTLSEALQAGTSSSDMHRAVDELVRPLAHDLDRKAVLETAPKKEIRKRIKLLPVVRTALYETPYNPGWTALMAVTGTLSSRIWTSGFLAVLDSVAMGLVIWAVFRLARRLTLFGAWVPVIWFVTGVLVAVAGSLITTGSVQFTSGLLLFSVNIFAPAMIVSLIGAFDRNAKKNLDALREVIAELEWETHSLEQRTWVEQRRLARFVHSELQSRIRAFALRMDLAARMPTDAEISELKAECEVALSTGNEQRAFDLFMEDIAELWQGLMEIRFSDSIAAITALRSDSYATAVAIEICREGIGNAAKHGKASKVELSLAVEEEPFGNLHIEIRNQGVEPANRELGFGLRMIEELATNWSLTRRESFTILEAVIPINLPGKQGDKRNEATSAKI